MKPLIKAGIRRELQEEDIYAVTNSMKSEKNTKTFAKFWQTELNKENPSIFRVLLNVCGYKAITLIVVYSIGLTLAR